MEKKGSIEEQLKEIVREDAKSRESEVQCPYCTEEITVTRKTEVCPNCGEGINVIAIAVDELGEKI